MVTTTRAKQRAALLAALSKYRGGRFQTSGSGGASGMVFHVDQDGRQFYIGSVQEPHAGAIVTALNLTQELLEQE